MGVKLLILLAFICGSSAIPYTIEKTTKGDSPKIATVKCEKNGLKDVTTADGLYQRLLPHVVKSSDDELKVSLKKEFMKYLIHSRTFLDLLQCTSSNTSPEARLLQEDEDDDDGGGGGGGAGAGGAAGAINPALDNTNVINGVRRILANVFTGNLIGIIQEGVALRGPEPVATVFTDVLSTLFGSAATAGITGVIGNLTTTPPPQVENVTLSYEEQQYLLQHHQLLLQQQQAQLGGIPPGQGFPGQVGAPPLPPGPGLQGQGYPGQIGGVQGQYISGTNGLPQNYPQYQQQHPSVNQLGQQQQQLAASQGNHGLRRPGLRPGAGNLQQPQQAAYQQQQTALPQQQQPALPQQQQPSPLQQPSALQKPQRQYVNPQASQLAGGLDRQPLFQGQANTNANNRLKLHSTALSEQNLRVKHTPIAVVTQAPLDTDDYEDNDEE